MSCPVCYTNDTSLLICWNSHALCDPCYRTMMSSARGHANRNCAECRVPMFSWVTPHADPCLPFQSARIGVRPPQRYSAIAGRQVRVRHCSVCTMTDHDRRTCPVLRQREARRVVLAVRDLVASISSSDEEYTIADD